MDLKLEGKLAMVTGSTAGIGFAIAQTLSAEGARVIVNGRTPERVTRAIDEIRRDHPAAQLEAFPGDLSNAATAQSAFERFHDVDILVNNLGVYEAKAFEEITDADWQRLIEINFMSGVRLSRCWLPGMKQKGWGRIIFISSESAINIPVEMVHYGVTKTMQVALARGLAEGTAGTGVTVNSILAGPTRSEALGGFVAGVARQRGIGEKQVEEEFFQTVRPSSLLRRFEEPEEIASLVAFVASPLSSGTNGAALRVEGGVVRSIL